MNVKIRKTRRAVYGHNESELQSVPALCLHISTILPVSDCKRGSCGLGSSIADPKGKSADRLYKCKGPYNVI